MKAHAYLIQEYFEVHSATLFYRLIFDRCVNFWLPYKWPFTNWNTL